MLIPGGEAVVMVVDTGGDGGWVVVVVPPEFGKEVVVVVPPGLAGEVVVVVPPEFSGGKVAIVVVPEPPAGDGDNVGEEELLSLDEFRVQFCREADVVPQLPDWSPPTCDCQEGL